MTRRIQQEVEAILEHTAAVREENAGQEAEASDEDKKKETKKEEKKGGSGAKVCIKTNDWWKR